VKAHAAVAAELLGSEELVWCALEDLESSPLKSEEKALLRFVDKVNRDSVHIGPEDMAPLHEGGWSDEAIYFAITVCALFNFYNRWVDATGVHPMSEEAHRAGGKRMALAGYVRSR
jgi:alkylhydroperoxidase family enzyme